MHAILLLLFYLITIMYWSPKSPKSAANKRQTPVLTMEYEYNWHIFEPHSLDFLVYDRLDNINTIITQPTSVTNRECPNVSRKLSLPLHARSTTLRHYSVSNAITYNSSKQGNSV